jgi:hypothetical protein
MIGKMKSHLKLLKGKKVGKGSTVGCRPSQEKRLFLEEKHARRKRQLEGKATCAREAGEACMQGRPNDARVRVFVMYCNG